MSIVPDGMSKIVLYVVEENVRAYFQTGIWSEKNEVTLPPNASVYGIRFKILAPEYVFGEEIASIKQTIKQLDLDFWTISYCNSCSLESFVQHVDWFILKELVKHNEVDPRKLRLSQLLYHAKGKITAEQVSDQIGWGNRQINRYLNKYLGISLKTYLNILRCYYAMPQISEGKFFPEEPFYDQPHFIREVKKHTGHSPRELHRMQNDRFIQLKNIRP